MDQSRVTLSLQFKLPLLWLVVLGLCALLLPSRLWTTMLIGLGGLFLVAYFWVWQLKHGLHSSRKLSYGWVAVGDRLEEQFALWNGSVVPALWVEIIDHSTVPDYHVTQVRSVGPQEWTKWRSTAVSTRRGQFQIGPWAIRTSDPFGIFILTRHYDEVEEVIIHPPIHGKLPVRLPLGKRSGDQRLQRLLQRATVNAGGLRDYQSGDPLRWIHWPSTARRRQLMVREFDLETAGDVWLLVDMRQQIQLGAGVDGTEEQGVLLAASLAAEALRQNRAVGLAAYGQQPQLVRPAVGEGQRWRILRTLALVEADGETGLANALADLGHVARRGTTAVLITAAKTADWLPALLGLAQRGIAVAVLLLERQSFGDDTASTGLQQAIRQLGVDCTLIRQGELGEPLEQAARRGFWEFRVTGTGKVVVVNRPD